MKALFLVALLASSAAAQDEPRHFTGLAVGVNYLGGQVDYDFKRGGRLEGRFLTNKQTSGEGSISTAVLGLRAVQRFRLSGVYHPYVGAEVSYVNASANDGPYNIKGVAPGLFLGVERPVFWRLSAGADIGPYVFLLRENTTHTANSYFDVVANAFLLFHF